MEDRWVITTCLVLLIAAGISAIGATKGKDRWYGIVATAVASIALVGYWIFLFVR